MRIIAGKYRSRRLVTKQGDSTRPTLDQVKESFFSSMGNMFEGGRVLDLFSGSGAIALEFISRGYDYALCVDNDYQAVQVIKENVNVLGCQSQVKVIKSSYVSALNQLKGETFDMIYIDPPYMQCEYYQNALQLIIENQLLANGGKIALECEKEFSEEAIHSQFIVKKVLNYRKNKIIILQAGNHE